MSQNGSGTVAPLPTKEHDHECPLSGNNITTEVTCPEGWEVVSLNPYSLTLERTSDGVTVTHQPSERPARDGWDDTLLVDGVEVLNEKEDISERDMVEYISQL